MAISHHVSRNILYGRARQDDPNGGLSADAASTPRPAGPFFDRVSALGVCYVAEVGDRHT